MELPNLTQKLQEYSTQDFFNCDESVIFYQTTPDKTPLTCSSKGRTSQKSRFTFLACFDAEGSYMLPLFFIENIEKQRCFKNKSSTELFLHYATKKMAWMTKSLFGEWI